MDENYLRRSQFAYMHTYVCTIVTGSYCGFDRKISFQWSISDLVSMGIKVICGIFKSIILIA